mgnify:CR=1 FL=1
MRTPWRTGVMKICSFLGTEDFYTPLVGLLTWLVKNFIVVNNQSVTLITIKEKSQKIDIQLIGWDRFALLIKAVIIFNFLTGTMIDPFKIVSFWKIFMKLFDI